ncbi:uncharacterized protein LOC131928102 isoform X2 [Physella acuta]|uniref:uncharacterized protein LOC131928102 isoform X2 n=1 Tax=Physella acuta TaxID=109671 RepID=UPI0027DCE81D|nr:uncharacterized protein LOC131928102 isoform X2 [Physella acuta]XP_059140006.1 uncharacterized protein LOC131928102 isoform X2 [Physella acuta]
MVILAKDTQKILSQIAVTLSRCKFYIKHTERNNVPYFFPMERLFETYNDAVMSMRREHGIDFDVKNYLTTPQISKLSKTVSVTFLSKLIAANRFMRRQTEYMADYGYLLRPSSVCNIRSGMEFFFTTFADKPYTYHGRIAVYKDLRVDNYRPFIFTRKEFDVELKLWTSKYQLLEDEKIPANIPESHWWWSMAAQDKQKTFI